MDKNYWLEIRSGSSHAMMSLYKESYQDLYAFGFRICASKEQVKDCIHEMFCEIWQKKHTLAEVSNVKAYLKTYLKRKLLKEIHQINLKDDIQAVPDAIGKEQSYEYLLIESQETDEQKQKIWNALEKLTKSQREIIKLKFYEGLSYDQIAIALNLQPRTVYNHVYEALQTLRSFMKIILLLFYFYFT